MPDATMPSMNQKPLQDLSAAGIAAFSTSCARRIAVDVVAETGSTNADLLARIDQLTAPTLLLALSQTAGRGRAGRSWLSEPGSSLTFSLAWKFHVPVQSLAGLSLAVGVILAETLGDDCLALKWPNDLLRNGDKAGGILIETALDRQPGVSAVWAVIGIGLNLAMPARLARRIGRPAGELANAEQDRNQLMARLLDGLAAGMQSFEIEGFAAFVERWNRLHAYAGKAVCIIDRDKILHEGVAAGVDGAGRLLLDTPGGPVAVVAGDVSLRAT